jgi:hypothetical protein
LSYLALYLETPMLVKRKARAAHSFRVAAASPFTGGYHLRLRRQFGKLNRFRNILLRKTINLKEVATNEAVSRRDAKAAGR